MSVKGHQTIPKIVTCKNVRVFKSPMQNYFFIYEIHSTPDRFWYENQCYSIFAVDCEWSDWSFGECSKSCGVGTRMDYRFVRVNASNGGKDCQGLSNIQENCNIQECPGSFKKLCRSMCLRLFKLKLHLVFRRLIDKSLHYCCFCREQNFFN